MRSKVEEGELVRRVRAGERDAFEELAARHGGSLLRVARLLARDEVAAGELVQEVWSSLLRALDGLDERAVVRTWLLRSLARRAKARVAPLGLLASLSAAAAPGADEPAVEPRRFDARGRWADPPLRWENPRELALQPDTRAVIEAAVEELPLAQRVVLLLHDIEGLEEDEIRDLVGVHVADQWVLLHRARARVARALDAHARGGRAVRVRPGSGGGSRGHHTARGTSGA